MLKKLGFIELTENREKIYIHQNEQILAFVQEDGKIRLHFSFMGFSANAVVEEKDLKNALFDFKKALELHNEFK